MSTLKEKDDLIKEMREQLVLLKRTVTDLQAQLKPEGLTKEAIGLTKDKDGNFKKMVFKYNPDTHAVAFQVVEMLPKAFTTAAYRMREHLEMKIFNQL